MSVIGHSPLAGASGAAGGGDPLYVDDVFSTFLYEGNGGTATVDNGIDLSGEGGLLWIKNRSSSHNHVLVDSERSGTNLAGNQTLFVLTSNNSNSELTNVLPTLFTSTGFTTQYSNSSSDDYASWAFRKAPGFFDVVTYNGTGSAQNISHSLGSVPGMIMIHCRDGTHDWEVYHRSTGATKSLHLNKTDAQATDSTVWNDTTPTSSVFTVGTSSNVNQNGHGYVAYVFSHDEQSFGTDSDEAIIKCGNYSGSSSEVEVNLGFEPQWLLFKCSSTSSSWSIVDNMRGLSHSSTPRLRANLSNAEQTTTPTAVKLTPTGFIVTTANSEYNSSGRTFVYMAIHRPNKPPTAGTEVFKSVLQTGHPQTISVGFPTDLAFTRDNTNTSHNYFVPRLTNRHLISDTSNAESNADSFEFDLQNSFSSGTWWGSGGAGTTPVINYYFKRAPGFFDVVAADYPGSLAAISHNLGVAPELIINKPRDGTIVWMVGSDYLQNTNGWNRYFELNSSGSEGGTSSVWNQTAPTATHFTLGPYPGSSYSGIFYLFATLDGISKVGSYSGTGSNINVDCGFISGARFILIKRTDSTGDWYVWDSTRGIVSGNDPYFRFNHSNGPVTNTDYIDPLNAGFTVTSSAPAEINASGGTYLFLAIA